MNFKNVKNPVDREVTLNYKGNQFSIGAKETKSFPNDVADQWVSIYDFMSCSPMTIESRQIVKEEVDEVVEETEEEVEEVEEPVIKKGKKK